MEPTDPTEVAIGAFYWKLFFTAVLGPYGVCDKLPFGLIPPEKLELPYLLVRFCP